ncbi:MAG: ATP-binding protein [Clostridia bacterium]|nr:ATP-binding protein [Clostridia bacterium]
MNNIESIETTESLPLERELRDDEYINESDGLIYCSVCGTPRQCRNVIFGLEFTPHIMCRCQTEEYERVEAELAQREFREKVLRMKSVGLPDRGLYECTFENDKGYFPEIDYAHKYVEKWDAMKENPLGMLLWGDVGTGKTFFAGCIANALLERGIPVLMVNFARLLNTLGGLYPDDRIAYTDGLNSYDLLIIDDFGAERNTEFANEQIFNVIDSRYRSRKPLIVTTNLTLSELKNPTELARCRIYSRILERCTAVRINSINVRKLIAARNMELAKEMLS